MDKKRYMISDAANIVNVESHVLRYWEVELELDIPRNEMGHRYYTEENIKQFQQIKSWKEQGYQLKAIRIMVHNDEGSYHPVVNIREAKPRSEFRAVREEKKKKVVQHMEGPMKKSEIVAENHSKKAVNMSDTANNSVKLEQFQSLMTNIVKNAIAENNFDLGREVGDQVGEKVLKEMNYLMRVQEEAEEERFRKLDEVIRTRGKKGRKSKEEKTARSGRFFNKEKKLNPNLNV